MLSISFFQFFNLSSSSSLLSHLLHNLLFFLSKLGSSSAFRASSFPKRATVCLPFISSCCMLVPLLLLPLTPILSIYGLQHLQSSFQKRRKLHLCAMPCWFLSHLLYSTCSVPLTSCSIFRASSYPKRENKTASFFFSSSFLLVLASPSACLSSAPLL